MTVLRKMTFTLTLFNGQDLVSAYKERPKISLLQGFGCKNRNAKFRLFEADFQSTLLGALIFKHSSHIFAGTPKKAFSLQSLV